MIIYGNKAVHLKTVKSINVICPNCKTKGLVTYSPTPCSNTQVTSKYSS